MKQNKHRAKRKVGLDNLCASMRALIVSFIAFLLSCFTLISCPRSPALLLSSFKSPFCQSHLFAFSRNFTALLSHLVPILVSESLVILLSLFVLGPAPPYLTFKALRIFKQAFLDKFLRRHLTIPLEFLYPFQLLGLLLYKTNRKQTFDTAFINSRPYGGNHI